MQDLQSLRGALFFRPAVEEGGKRNGSDREYGVHEWEGVCFRADFISFD